MRRGIVVPALVLAACFFGSSVQAHAGKIDLAKRVVANPYAAVHWSNYWLKGKAPALVGTIGTKQIGAAGERIVAKHYSGRGFRTLTFRKLDGTPNDQGLDGLFVRFDGDRIAEVVVAEVKTKARGASQPFPQLNANGTGPRQMTEAWIQNSLSRQTATATGDERALLQRVAAMLREQDDRVRREVWSVSLDQPMAVAHAVDRLGLPNGTAWPQQVEKLRAREVYELCARMPANVCR